MLQQERSLVSMGDLSCNLETVLETRVSASVVNPETAEEPRYLKHARVE
jgi:hypothetical protein